MEGDLIETLGVPAHPGGLVVRRPELSVGVLRMVSRPSGLELELLARRPPAGRRRGGAAPRVLLPAYDEGVDLRLGVLDDAGRARWAYPVSGDHGGGSAHQLLFTLPPAFDRVSLVFAWPEIGFPETVVPLPLPDRATVERGLTSIWHAPVAAVPTTERFEHRDAHFPGEVAIETGTAVAAPRVLHRGERAAVVLTRLAVVEPGLLSAGVACIAKGDAADASSVRRPAFTQPARRRTDAGPNLAVVRAGEAFWLGATHGSFSGGDGIFTGTRHFLLEAPGDDLLDLLVAWPGAELADARVRIPLSHPPHTTER